MTDFLAALGLFLVIEGLLYALAPGIAKRVAEAASATPPDTLRLVGVVSVSIGVALVWAIRR